MPISENANKENKMISAFVNIVSQIKNKSISEHNNDNKILASNLIKNKNQNFIKNNLNDQQNDTKFSIKSLL